MEVYCDIISLEVSEMNVPQTVGLSSYKQTVQLTPGLASSVWIQGTSALLPAVVQIIPLQFERKDEKPLEEKTA